MVKIPAIYLSLSLISNCNLTTIAEKYLEQSEENK